MRALLVLPVFISVCPASMAETMESAMPSTTLLFENDRFSAYRQNRHFIVSLKQPHRVLSTSDINGGEQKDLDYLVNFQSVEGNGHDTRFKEILHLSNEQYHQELAATLNLDSNKMASMGTAANINNLVHVQKRFREITIDTFVTAGVKGNALRAGDPTHWYQSENGNEYIPLDKQADSDEQVIHKNAGTINIILLLNRTLLPGAQAKVATLIAEAKSAALAELAIPSKQSKHIATGTGTDQYAIASPISSSMKALDSASGHLKLGELIGSAVREAVFEAIGLESNLEPAQTRSVIHALSRFGASEEAILSRLQEQLGEESYLLLLNNKRAALTEAKLVAASYAYAAVLDRLQYDTLSKHVQNDVLLDQAANAAVALSGKSQSWQLFRSKLAVDQNDLLNVFLDAIALGWDAKWQQ